MDPPLDDVDTHISVIAMLRRRRLDRNAERDIRQFISSHSAFEREVQHYWDAALDAYLRSSMLALQFGEELSPILHQELAAEAPHLANVLTRLHANACRVALEVWELLSSGFAQGAFARWRTLHEIATTALFLHEHGEDVAHRFWMHGGIERRRLLREYQRLADEHPAAGFEPLDAELVEEINGDRNNLIERWGRDFGNVYGWAAEALGIANPNFRDIEGAVDFLPIDSRWMYKWASIAIHPQVWGITVNLGLDHSDEGVLAGPSLLGLDLPANNSLISLQQVTSSLGTLAADGEWAIRLRVVSSVIDDSLSVIQQIASTATSTLSGQSDQHDIG